MVRVRGTHATGAASCGGNGCNQLPRPGFMNQRSEQWDLFVEKRFGSSWLLSAGYSGSKGSHLLQTRFILQSAQLVPQPLLDSWRQGYIDSNGRSDPGSVQIPNSLQPANGPLIPFFGDYGRATVSQLEANLPYPLFANLRRSFTDGWSNYHSLLLQVNRRFSNGLLVNAHYTWSKSLDFTQSETEADEFFDSGALQGVQNLRNYRNNYGYSLFDIPHRAVVSYLYELPFGAGKSLKVGNPVLNWIVTGWRTGGVLTLQSGAPIQVTGATNGALNARLDRVPGVPAEVPKEWQRWYDGKTTVTLPDGRRITPCNFCFLKFNPDAFQGRVVTTPNGSVVNDVYWFGNAAWTYNNIRDPGMNNLNISIDRTFRVREKYSVEFSAQFTNALNHVQFRPDINPSLGSTNIIVGSPTNIRPGQGQNNDFGTLPPATFDPRQVEFPLKFRF